MKITEGRRLAAILGIYIGVFSIYVLAPRMRPYAFPIGLTVTLIFAAALCLKNKKAAVSAKNALLIALAALSLVFACVRGSLFIAKTEAEAQKYLDQAPHTVTGAVTEVLYEKNYGSSYEIALSSVDRKEADFGVMLYLPYNGALSVGDTVRFEAVFSEPDREYGAYRKADGVLLTAESEAVEMTGGGEVPRLGLFGKLRLAIKTNFEAYMNDTEAGFATALLTGNKENLGARIRLAFTRIGISHILAVSGLHLSIVIGGLDLLGRWIGVPRKLKNFILIACTVFFAGICGFSASIVRAAVMHSFYYVADTIGERNDSPTSLFVAIFLIVLVNPASVYDVGMWMSFLATFGILTAAPIISDMIGWDLPRTARKILGFFLSLICMTLSAVFFTLPITWTAFGGVSLLSPLANLIFIPLTQIILYLLIVLTLVGGIPFLANPIGQAAQLLISVMTELAEAVSDWKGIYVSLRYPFVAWVIAALIVGILAVLFIRRVKLVHIFTVFALCCVIYGAGYFAYAQAVKDSAYVYLQTDGKSDAVGVVSGNETVIIDISTGGYSVLSDAAKHAEDFYACEIDVLVLTHYHSYHANTLHRLTESVKVRRLLLPTPSSEQDREYYRELCDQLEGIVEIDTYQADGTQRLEVGNAEIALPRTEYIKRSTHPIVSFSVSLEDKGLSYLGESATETDVYGMENAVMIFGSHGPSAKHIFDPSPIADAELVVFADRSYMELTDTEAFADRLVFPEDYGGWIRILFE